MLISFKQHLDTESSILQIFSLLIFQIYVLVSLN